MKTTKDKLQHLHDLLAETFCDAVENGVPVRDENTGIVHKAPAPNALIAIARQFLKDNNIEALVVPGSKLAGLAASLPFAGSSEYDDMDHSTH